MATRHGQYSAPIVHKFVGLAGDYYRLVSKPKFKGLITEGAVHGYRGFTELMVHKGFFLHAEYEMLKVCFLRKYTTVNR